MINAFLPGMKHADMHVTINVEMGRPTPKWPDLNPIAGRKGQLIRDDDQSETGRGVIADYVWGGWHPLRHTDMACTDYRQGSVRITFMVEPGLCVIVSLSLYGRYGISPLLSPTMKKPVKFW